MSSKSAFIALLVVAALFFLPLPISGAANWALIILLPYWLGPFLVWGGMSEPKVTQFQCVGDNAPLPALIGEIPKELEDGWLIEGP